MTWGNDLPVQIGITVRQERSVAAETFLEDSSKPSVQTGADL
jgi:hypothetical protein